MWDACFVLLRFIAGLIGVLLCFYLPFLREDEDKHLDALDVKVKDKLSEWWIKIDDAKKYNLSRHTMFMRVVSDIAASIFDRLFGKRLFSFQSVAVSICFSVASLGIASLIFLSLRHYVSTYFGVPSNFNTNRAFPLILVTLFFIILGAFPLLFSRWRRWKLIWYFLLTLTTIINILAISILGFVGARILTGNAKPADSDAIMLSQLISMILMYGLAIGFACDVWFIAITRKALRWSSGLDSFIKITTVILLNIILALALTVGPILIGRTVDHPLGPVSFISLIVAYSNVINFFAAILFIALAMTMLVHRLFYYVLDRPIYLLQRVGFIRRKKLGVSIGVALLGFALGIEVPTLAKDILKDIVG